MAFNIFNKDKKEKKAVAPAMDSIKTESAEKTIAILPQSQLKFQYVSEKSTRLQEEGKYVFAVSRVANKNEIKKQVAKQYKVEVKDVHMVNLPAKKRIVGRFMGFKAGARKAIVTLAKGQKIEQAV